MTILVVEKFELGDLFDKYDFECSNYLINIYLI